MQGITKSKLEELYNDCVDELNKVLFKSFRSSPFFSHIAGSNVREIKLNTRKGMTRLGICRKKCYGDVEVFFIEITESYASHPEVTEKEVKNTIMHELIHTLPGCFNHGHFFKVMAKTLNGEYGYNIQRTNENPNAKQQTKTYKYIITCNSCGRKYMYQKYSKLIKLIDKYPNVHGCTCVCGSNDLKLKKI